VIDGHKVPIARPRVRSKVHNREIPLGSYELFQRASLLEESVWHKIMHGLSTRNYKEVLQQFSDAYGVEKSTVSEHFIEASRKKLEIVMTRSLSELSIDVMMIDGTIFKGFHLVVAIGIDRFGHKIVLGLRQGATENAVVVGELLSELAERGLTFSQPRLYVVDGGKAIRRAILNHAGDAAFIQRCQVHKIRNVCEHVPDTQKSAVKYKMRCAYEMTEAADAQQALWKLHDELLTANPSAAASLMEGMEETLTVLELRVGYKLRRSVASTNGIESSFSVTERICRQVKRWQGSDHRLRWVASTLLFAESRWNRLIGYHQIEALVSSMKAEYALRLQKQKAALRSQVSAA
jgi:putative transposase